jgi:hypothetical protein
VNLPANDILIDNIVFSIGVSDQDAMGAAGKMAGRSNRLLLAADQTPGDLLDTFGHEVLHAIIRTRCPRALTDEVEETLVQALVPGIIQVLRDNPDWLAWAVRLVLTSGKRQPKTRPIAPGGIPSNQEKENSDAGTSKSEYPDRPEYPGQGPGVEPGPPAGG